MAQNRKSKPQKSQTGATSGNLILWLTLGGILALTTFLYYPSLDNAFTNWDDDVYVTENALLSQPGNLKAIWETQVGGNHHPITVWSLAVNYQSSGENPYTYHLWNLLIHLMNTFLVFFFIHRLSRGKYWAATFTALLFAIHPMHVESVAWVSERKDVLYTFFFLAGLILYLEFLKSEKNKYFFLGGVFIVYVLSCLSKPAAVVFPFVLVALDYFYKREDYLKLALEKIPMIAVSIWIGLWTIEAQKVSGAVDDPNRWTFLQKTLFASYGSMMYVVKMILPFNLSAIYPYPNKELKDGSIEIGPEFYLAPFVILAGFALLYFFARKNRVIVFGTAFFFINLILVLQFFTVGQAVMADRYTYVPYIGLFFALSFWLEGEKIKDWLKKGLFVLMIWMCLVSVVQTYERVEIWKDTETLWTDTIEKFPRRIPVAYNNRGHFYRKTKRPDLAANDYLAAIQLNAKYQLAWANLGNIYFDKGKMDSAIVCYDKAISLKNDLWETYGNRGAARASMKDYEGGLSDLNLAVKINPNYRMGISNRALVKEMVLDFPGAVEDYKRVIALDPKNVENHRYFNALGVAYQRLQKFQESLDEFTKAISLNPKGANATLGIYFLNRSYSYNALGNMDMARKDAQSALQYGATIDPTYRQTINLP